MSSARKLIMEQTELFREIKSSLSEIYVAYCKKDKSIPEKEWMVSRDELHEKLLNNIVGCVEFILRSSPDGEKTYIEEVGKGEIIEIEHPEPDFKRVSIRTALEEIISTRKVIYKKKRKEIFRRNSTIIAMKYLRTAYSRSYALIIIPFVAFKENYVIIFSSDIEELSYPVINSESGLAVIVLSNALRGKLKDGRWFPLKIALYPALYQGERKEGFVKIYDENKTFYWARLFETFKLPPKSRRVEILAKMLEISAKKHGVVPDDAREDLIKILEEEKPIDMDEIARSLQIEHAEEYNKIKKDVSRKYSPFIKPEDLDAEVKIEGRGFVLQVKLSLLLSQEGDIKIFEHKGNIGILLKRIEPIIKVSGKKKRKIVSLRKLIERIPTLFELVH